MERQSLAVYFIMGTENCKEDPLTVLEDALIGGITCFQFREKGNRALNGEAYVDFARSCQKLCQKYNVPFIVNDDVELALQLEADGIHVGQDDMPLSEVRQKFKGKIVGVSVHNDLEMGEAVLNGANYVGIGPIYETKSKLDANPVSGVTFLLEACIKYPTFPIVAIGGITGDNYKHALEAGADGVAVISAICQSENRKEIIKKLKSY